jgi:hypothetical protein
MDDLDELIGLARNLAEEVVGAASELLSGGADIDRIHRRYVIGAIELLADAEAQAILATSDDEDALPELMRIVNDLARLRDDAHVEASTSQEGDDSE